jgi:hypothetical protein
MEEIDSDKDKDVEHTREMTSINKQIMISGWDDRIDEMREILMILGFDFLINVTSLRRDKLETVCYFKLIRFCTCTANHL